MNDKRLLNFYLRRAHPSANRWNLSPANLSAELLSRRMVQEWIPLSKGMTVCSLGIGVGEWDDFLGYWLDGFGTLTSVDRSESICQVFRFRQKRERHPNPARVVCSQFARLKRETERYDLVTLIGDETKSSLSAALSILNPLGRIFYMGFSRRKPQNRFVEEIRSLGGAVVETADSRANGLDDFAVLIRRRGRRRAPPPNRSATAST